MLVSLCAETIKPVSEGGENLTAVEGNASVHQVNPVSRITGEGRAGACIISQNVGLGCKKPRE